MRRLLILTLATLLVCVAVCTASQIVIDRLLTRAHDMNTEIHMAMEKGDESAPRGGRGPHGRRRPKVPGGK